MHILLNHLLGDVQRTNPEKFNPKFWEDIFQSINTIDVKYFEDDFWRGSPDENGMKGKCTLHGTSMSAFNQLAGEIIQAWDQYHFSREAPYTRFTKHR